MIHVQPELARLPGISDVRMFGQRDYSMRIWLDPDKLAIRNMTAGDVVAALREQNLQVAAGQIGQSPTVPRPEDPDHADARWAGWSSPSSSPTSSSRRRPTAGSSGSRTSAASSWARRTRTSTARSTASRSANLAIFQLPDANALDTADIVKAKIEELSKDFPEGLDYMIRYDTTPFIRESIQEVFKTLLDAVILVALVVLLFLQNWRSAIIPLVAVPVAIVGTFAVMLAMGFSLNNLTLFGLVLAIGIVVDDAIVVVEAVEHHIEHGLTPRDATIKAMSEVSAPVIAVGLVLSAVFIPCAFITGITGQFFRQFALTIAVVDGDLDVQLADPEPGAGGDAAEAAAQGGLRRAAVAGVRDDRGLGGLRVAGALPAGALRRGIARGRCRGRGDLARLRAGEAVPASRRSGAALLAVDRGRDRGLPPDHPAGEPGAGRSSSSVFNRGFTATANGYARLVGGMLRVFVLVLVVYGGLLALTYWGFTRTPRGFIPSQDMGYLLVNVQLPDSASPERTQAVIDRINDIAHEIPGVNATVGISGQSILLSAFGSNFGTMFVTLDDFDKRQTADLYYEAIANKLRRRLGDEIHDATIMIFGPPPVRGVGRAGGFMVMIEDRGDLGPRALQEQTENLVELANQQPELVPGGNTSVFRANVPQVFLDVDRTALHAQGGRAPGRLRHAPGLPGLALRQRLQPLRPHLAGHRPGRGQVPRPDRGHPPAARCATPSGTMVPLGALADVREINGPLVLTRYNMYPAASINGNARPGRQLGQAIDVMSELAERELPKSMSFEWTELAYLELQAGNTAMIVFALRRSSWSSWCWRRSSRAGRCRWR